MNPGAHMSRILAANIRLISKRLLAITPTPLTVMLSEGAGASAVLILSPCPSPLLLWTLMFVSKTAPCLPDGVSRLTRFKTRFSSLGRPKSASPQSQLPGEHCALSPARSSVSWAQDLGRCLPVG